MTGSRLAAVALTMLLSAIARADSITHNGTTINMDFVTVGNPYNEDDIHMLQGLVINRQGRVDNEYRIGTYEVSENQWDAVVDADVSDLLYDSGFWSGDQPVGHISANDMAMFCNWLTTGDVTKGAYTIEKINSNYGRVIGINRYAAIRTYGMVYVISSEDEWYKAAYYDPDKPGGAGYWDYPTGSDDMPDGIDFDGDLVFDAVFGEGYDQGYPNAIDNAGVLSPYGTMGQGGNIVEQLENRQLRGGYWLDGGVIGLKSSFSNGIRTTGKESSMVGFRVVSTMVAIPNEVYIPEPSTAVMLWMVLGCLLLSRRRTNKRTVCRG